MNAGARLDRLPISSFHRRILWLIGIGMFFDGFDIYVAGAVLGATLKSGFSTMGQNAEFVSVTFLGMMLGAFVTGFLGTGTAAVLLIKPTWQFLACVSRLRIRPFDASADTAAICDGGRTRSGKCGRIRHHDGIRSPQARGKWLGIVSVFVVSGLPVTGLLEH